VKLHLVTVEFLFGCLLAFPVASSSPETSWDALRHLSKHHLYTVLNRDGSCFTGQFVSVLDNAFVMEQDGEKKLLRPNIVRISNGETPDVHNAVFSAKLMGRFGYSPDPAILHAVNGNYR
jgi:hypothetical protein